MIVVHVKLEVCRFQLNAAFHGATRKQYSAEEKIRIVLDGLKGEDSNAELSRREGIAQSVPYLASIIDWI